MGTKNMRKTKSYVTKGKFFKSAKALQRHSRPKKKCKGKSWSLRGPLSPLKIFTLKNGNTPYNIVQVKNHKIMMELIKCPFKKSQQSPKK